MSQTRLRAQDSRASAPEMWRTHREIAASIGIANSTVSDYLRRVSAVGFSWPWPEGLDDGSLVVPPFSPPPPARVRRPEPHWNRIHRELQRLKGVRPTLITHMRFPARGHRGRPIGLRNRAR